MASAAGEKSVSSLLGDLPSSRPGLFSRYNPEMSHKAPPRLPPQHAAGGGAAPVVVRSEGTSVLVRELERVHLRNKATTGHKRAAPGAKTQQQRKQPRRRQQQAVEGQEGGGGGGDNGDEGGPQAE
ncbi:hypothetical protein Rsub_02649 [Raphidocelis subcapitata]|uniref:DET1- and DDB1-associated protein 1 n=1 Tax=Raphidocelis subcapitata TaxID=307507 RepID=A0A2V0NYP9_9CHLO|nr:hypothetical protein Rsub_02649 [Raphidocelis subcapitata]|eukprot:GBF89945.1 hypothetical protein Rsub_02649 [Raphidocelis subcapitata]